MNSKASVSVVIEIEPPRGDENCVIVNLNRLKIIVIEIEPPRGDENNHCHVTFSFHT